MYVISIEYDNHIFDNMKKLFLHEELFENHKKVKWTIVKPFSSVGLTQTSGLATRIVVWYITLVTYSHLSEFFLNIFE